MQVAATPGAASRAAQGPNEKQAFYSPAALCQAHAERITLIRGLGTGKEKKLLRYRWVMTGNGFVEGGGWGKMGIFSSLQTQG